MPVNTILGLFAKSPIKPLQKHIVKVHQCSQQLVPFFDAVAEDRWEDAEKIRQQIAQLEKEADITISTGIEYSSVYIFGAASHIYITAILDILIYQLDRAKKDASKNVLADDVEYLLSETKL